MIDENVYILWTAETKYSFQAAQFALPGYHKPYRLDINDKQGGLLVYVKYHLPSKLLSTHNISNDIQIIPFESNLRKENWMFMCIYRPPKQNNQYFLENLLSIADHYTHIFGYYIFPGDFNMEPNCPTLTSFNSVKTNTCFKGKGSCIDQILTENIVLNTCLLLKQVQVIIIIWFILCSKHVLKEKNKNILFIEITKTLMI